MAKKKTVVPPEPEQILTKPEMRELAFWSDRLVGLEESVSARKDSKPAARKKAAEPLPLESAQELLARHRLEQFRLYRERLAEPEPSDSQKREVAVAGKYNWVPMGPSSVKKGQAQGEPLISGRVKGIAIAPGGMRVYIATANGGVWRSENGGESWASLMDRPGFSFDVSDTVLPSGADSLACGAIALVPGANAGQDVVYVGSGEPDHYGGAGPLSSMDGGRTWVREEEDGAPTGLLNIGFYAMAVDPDPLHPDRVVAATSRGIFRREPQGDHYVWKLKNLPLPPGIGAASSRIPTSVVAVQQGGATMFYAAAYFGWAPAPGPITQHGVAVYSSPDGDVWTPHGTGLPTDRVERISLGVSPNSPQVLYAQLAYARLTSADNPAKGAFYGIFRCANGGVWNRVSMPAVINNLFGPTPAEGGQGNYDNAFAVVPHPTDISKELLFLGGSGLVYNNEWVSTIYRCAVTRSGTAAAPVFTADQTYIGATVHADVHVFAFPPGDFNRLWVGCDGGVFRTDDARRGTPTFATRNYGLQTMTILHISPHPTEPGVLFAGTQDNGAQRCTGEPVWLKSFGGDSGYALIHQRRPERILLTHFNNDIDFNTDGGATGSRADRAVTLATKTLADGTTVIKEKLRFYSPLAAVLNPDPADPNGADLVAFGTERLWLSNQFGGNWQSIPDNQWLAGGGKPGDTLDPTETAARAPDTFSTLLYFSKNLIYGGTTGGNIYRYARTGAVWTHPLDPAQANVRLHQKPGAPAGVGAITSIIPDPADPSGNSIYISIGGASGGIWRYNGASWSAVRGTGGGGNLLAIHHSVVAAYQEAGNTVLYAGADLGVWRFRNAAEGWTPFAEGLPDAAVVDLKIIPAAAPRPALLLAATHGRGVYQRILLEPADPVKPVELYLRCTPLDQGWGPVDLTGKANPNDPTNAARNITAIHSPDIKLDVPDNQGAYQFVYRSAHEAPHFTRFADDNFEDRAQRAAAHDNTAVVASRAYVQVHNRGAFPANNVRVALLMASAAAAPPALPANHATELAAGRPVNSGGWTTIGISQLEGLQAGFPQVAAFDLLSDKLPAPAAFTASNRDYYLFAFIHSPDDPYSPAAAPDTETLARNNSKVTYKKIHIEAFTGALPVTASPEPLAGFVAVPPTATAPGAPFDSMLGFAMAQNDQVFSSLLGLAALSPYSAYGRKNIIHDATNPAKPETLLRANTIRLDTEFTAYDQTPVVWFATEKITLNARINATGKGSDGEGDFGGSGGFGMVNGNDCRLSGSRVLVAAGGLAADKNGKSPAAEWFSRALLMFQHLKGGAAGGSTGGRGGGVVCLFAPIIEFTASGRIEASGGAPTGGAGDAGGGGGGVIILIAHEFINVNEAAAHPQRNVITIGGAKRGAGGDGGAGVIFKKQIG